MDDFDMFDPKSFAFQEFMMRDDDATDGDDRPRWRDRQENPECPNCDVTLAAMSSDTFVCPRCNSLFRLG